MADKEMNCTTIQFEDTNGPHPLPSFSSQPSPIPPRTQPHSCPSSQPPIDSQPSIVPQPCISQLQPSGLFSQMSSMGFLPSLSSLWPDPSVEEMDHRCLATIKSERGAHISSLSVVGNYLYAGASSIDCSTNSIRIWQKVTMKECRGFGSGYGDAKALVAAGDRILSAHGDLKIRVWSRCRSTNRHRSKQVAEGDNELRVDVLQEVQAMDSIENSHKLLASMPTVKDYLKSFIPSKNYVQVRRHHKRLWIEHVDNISMLAVGGTTAEPVLYSSSWDRTIKVWKLSEFKCVESFKAHDDAINALLVAPQGFLFTASADAKVKLWGRPGTTTGGQKHWLIACLDAHKSAVNALALSHGEGGDAILYSAGCDRSIVVWETEESAQHMVPAGVLRGHSHAILCLVSRGRVLCSGGADHTIRVWLQAQNGRRMVTGGVVHACVAVLRGHSGPVKCLSLTNDAGGKQVLYSSSLDNDIKLWQLSGCVREGEEEEMGSTHCKSMEQRAAHQIWKYHSV